MTKLYFLLDAQGFCCGPDCEELQSVWDFKSCVHFRCRTQAILQRDSRLQNDCTKSGTLKLSSPEDLLTFISLLNMMMKAFLSICNKLWAIFPLTATDHFISASLSVPGLILWSTVTLMSIKRNRKLTLTKS